MKFLLTILLSLICMSICAEEKKPLDNSSTKETPAEVIKELRKKADDQNAFSTKGFYVGMSYYDICRLIKAYGVDEKELFFIIEDKPKKGILTSGEDPVKISSKDRDLKTSMIVFLPGAIEKLYSFAGCADDFASEFFRINAIKKDHKFLIPLKSLMQDFIYICCGTTNPAEVNKFITNGESYRVTSVAGLFYFLAERGFIDEEYFNFDLGRKLKTEIKIITSTDRPILILQKSSTPNFN